MAGPQVGRCALTFTWFTVQIGVIAPIFMIELVVSHPSYRQNISTFLILYALGGAIPLLISAPLAVKHRYWRSLLWLPTRFAFAFLRRLATLEAVISLPTRPLSVIARIYYLGLPG